jgi:hypothetical protein
MAAATFTPSRSRPTCATWLPPPPARGSATCSLRPILVNRGSTCPELAEAIDDAFARWDRSHLHEFTFPATGRIATEHRHGADFIEDTLDADITLVGEVLAPGAEFEYVFDLGDNWRHVCAVATEPVDLEREVGIVPDRPLPYFGWGSIPDPYGRLWEDDDGETPVPDPPVSPWPWPNAPAPVMATLHLPGQYTQLRELDAEPDPA